MRRIFFIALMLATPAPAYAQRTVLTAPLDLYVTPSGSDGNSCTSAAPCASQAGAMLLLQEKYDLGCQIVTIHVADGTYTKGGLARAPFIGACNGTASVQIVGDIANGNGVVIQPTSSYCWEADNGAAYFIEAMNCDQTKNFSSTAGQGQDMISVFNGATLEYNMINFRDNGNNGLYNDVTAVNATVIVDGCNPNGPGVGCGIGLQKFAGAKQQAHVLCDHCYMIWNNNNCVDPSPNNVCTPLYQSGHPNYSDFFIIINGGVINYGANNYPYPGASDPGNQCSIRTNGILFTAGNLASVPGAVNTCFASSGGQVE